MELKQNGVFHSRYLLVRHIGGGASAQVWMAKDTKANNLVVALKIFSINSGMDSYGFQNFEREFTSVYNLNHTNLLPPSSYDIWEGIPYLVLPYCENGSVSCMIGRTDEVTLIQFLHDVAAGLEYLHDHDIVHQDIKPDNILINDSCQFLVTDFGISVASMSDSEASSGSAGTRAYMGPERFGDMAIAVKSSDIWSLGATAFELLTGEAPFGDWGGLVQASGEKSIALPAELQPEVKKIIEDCLSLNTWDRPLAKDIRQKIELYWETGSWKRKSYKKIFMMAASIIVAVIIGAGVYIWDYNRTKVYYYKDYVEQMGIPLGIHKLSSSEFSHRARTYKFIEKKRKTIGVQLVNSQGHIVYDTESEYRDRGINMRINYTADGKASAVIYMNHCNHPLYRKEFKDDYIIFTYGDNITERFLPKELSDCYVRLENENETKGKISRYKVEYDTNGYIKSVHYANRDNRLIGDQFGIYGKEYLYDDKGRTIEERFLGVNDSLKAMPFGLAYKIKKYDDQDNWIETSYFDQMGRPAVDVKDGIFIYSLEYDKFGNMSAFYYRNPDGSLMMPKREGMSGCAGIKFEYDEKGNRIKDTYIGLDGFPCVSTNGIASLQREYDEYGYVSIQSTYDSDGKPAPDKDGGNYGLTQKNDSVGNILAVTYRNKDGNPMIITGGYATIRCQYDSLGYQTEYATFDEDGKLVDVSSIAITRWKYDSQGRIVYSAFWDESKKACKNEYGIYCIRNEYNELGQRTQLAYYQEDGKTLMKQNDGYAVWKSEYDLQGNRVKDELLDEQGKLCMTSLGYAVELYNYDDKGNLLQNRYYDMDNRLVSVYGIAGYNHEYDSRGNEIKSYPVGLNGKLSVNQYIETYKYDDLNNIIELAYWDGGEKPVIHSNGYHKLVRKYNSKNQIIEQMYYGNDNDLMNLAGYNYAIEQYVYDQYGNVIDEFYFGKDKRAVKDQNGVHHYSNEYDNMQRCIRKLRYDENGDVTAANFGAAETKFEYDVKNNEICRAFYDGKGMRVTLVDGWSYYRKTYDNKNHQLSIVYFGSDDSPAIDKNGKYHKATFEYNAQGYQIEDAYWGIHGEPVICISNYHKLISSYDEYGNFTEQCTLDTQGKPIDGTMGFQRAVYTYKNGRLRDSVKTYNANGTLTGTYSWDGKQWILSGRSSVATSTVPSSSKGSNWVQNMRELSSGLPMDLGEKANHLTILSCKILDERSCELIFTTPKSKYEMSQEELMVFVNSVRMILKEMKLEYLPSGISLTGILYDSKERKIDTIKE